MLFRSQLDGELAAMREAGTYKRERVITSPQAARITVAPSAARVLNMCANKCARGAHTGSVRSSPRARRSCRCDRN